MSFDFARYPHWAGKTVVIYDGDCPFCTNYVKYQRLRETVGSVLLLNAREQPNLVEEFSAANMPLDDGMVLILDGQVYYGADCLHRLAMLSSGRDWFNKMNAAVFRSRALSKALYPVLKAGRSVVLRVLGRSSLSTSDSNNQ